ncbi:MAG: Si-specific NAD(P)(+) transhydrogenase, partial [Myxococcota bacterium]|nr:Si-specific NAD(P)(+) transhydrogenase [Myxococcota bacterium]
GLAPGGSVTEDESKYELVVVGSGPAGEKAAVQAAYLGHRTCVIDKGAAGGAWVNTGTIPSKTLRESALYLAGGRHRGLYAPFSRDLTIRNLMALERRLVARWREKVEQSFRKHDVTRLCGRAHFVDAHTLELDDGTRAHGKHILIATGSRPRRLDAAPVDGVHVHDSDSVLSLDQIPDTLVVLGGGVIGCEYASMFQALGVQVTLLDTRDHLLGWLDPDASKSLEEIFTQGGMVVRHGVHAERVETTPSGVSVFLDDGTLTQGDVLLVAAGRVPNVEDLNLDVTGVKVTRWGTIPTNEYMQSEVPHIYAAGDVVGFPSLASVSMEQGRVASAHMFGENRGPLGSLFPYGVYTIPEVSCVGLTPDAAREKGYDPVCGTAGYNHSVRAAMLGAEQGMVKLVCERSTGQLLGATIVGAQATELVHFAAAVIQYGGTIHDLVRFVFNLPSLSVLFKQASYDILHHIRTGEHNEMVE